MGSVTVYGPPISPAVSRVLACLLEKDVVFNLVNIDMSKAQHKSPDFLKIQPFGQVPAFQDEHTTLFESRAICRYICDKYADRGNRSLLGRRGGGLVERAHVEQWLEAEGQSFNPPSSTLVFQLAFAPQMGLPQDPAAILLNEGKLAKVLDVYERRLQESRFLAGDEFSLADLSHLPNGHYIRAGGKEELFTSRKHVARWWEDISMRPSWRKVVEMQRTPPAMVSGPSRLGSGLNVRRSSSINFGGPSVPGGLHARVVADPAHRSGRERSARPLRRSNQLKIFF